MVEFVCLQYVYVLWALLTAATPPFVAKMPKWPQQKNEKTTKQINDECDFYQIHFQIAIWLINRTQQNAKQSLPVLIYCYY